eukprot:37263_1
MSAEFTERKKYLIANYVRTNLQSTIQIKMLPEMIYLIGLYLHRTLHSADEMKQLKKFISKNIDSLCCIVLLGAYGVGKSTLTYAIENKETDSMPPIDYDIEQETESSVDIFNGIHSQRIQILDIGANNKEDAMKLCGLQHHWIDCERVDGHMLIFDLTSESSFKCIKNVYTQLQCRRTEPIPQILVGNKCDIEYKNRQVAFSEAYDLAKQWNIDYIEISAKNITNIMEALESITETIVWRHFKKSQDKKSSKKNCVIM